VVEILRGKKEQLERELERVKTALRAVEAI
jgi:hypothetical protein